MRRNMADEWAGRLVGGDYFVRAGRAGAVFAVVVILVVVIAAVVFAVVVVFAGGRRTSELSSG
jgi:hypothetical protein